MTVGATAVYNFMIAQPQWTDRGEWGFYAGAGAGLGLGFIPEATYFNVGAVGMVGLEYTFDFPLQLSLDVRPQLGMVTVKVLDVTSREFGIWGWYPHLGIRYKF